jgi:hypothetical protein
MTFAHRNAPGTVEPCVTWPLLERPGMVVPRCLPVDKGAKTPAKKIGEPN